MKKILITVSNHPPTSWGMEQKEGWDEIVFIPFPSVDPHLSKQEVWEMAEKLASQIAEVWDAKARGGNQVRLWIAGDYSLTIFTLWEYIKNHWGPNPVSVFWDHLVFPTTERVVVEEKSPDGSIVKKSIFKFVQWR